jgi:hypothetical protein
MTAINRLNSVESLASSDLLPIYSQSNGDARKVSLSVLSEFVEASAASAALPVKQFASPSATGQTVTVADGDDSVWLIVTPSATYAAGTIKLPAKANCADQQEIVVNYVNGVNALTVDANGAICIGAPSIMAANAFFRLKFDIVMGTWYRVG